MAEPQDRAGMSAEQLRQKLLGKFQDTGIINDMQAQLRNRLVSELQVDTRVGSTKAKVPLIEQITNWLIAEHLRKYEYSYTLSVFMCESKTLKNTDSLFTLEDVLNLLHVNTKSRLYQKLLKKISGVSTSSILCHILKLLRLDLEPDTWREDQGIQTENRIETTLTYTYQEKLQQIEDLYYLKRNARHFEYQENIESHLIKYKLQIEEKLRKETKNELEIFKQRELLSVKTTEQEKCRTELEIHRKELEKEYCIKFDALYKREKKTLKDIESLKESLERETYNQRQEVLTQLDAARQQELDARRLAEKLSHDCELEKECMKSLEEKVKLREASIKQRETAVEELVQERCSRERLTEQQRHLKKMKAIQEEELKITSLKTQLELDRDYCDKIKTEYLATNNEMGTIRAKLANVQANNELLQEQNAKLLHELNDLEECRGSKIQAERLQHEMSALRSTLDAASHERDNLQRLVQDLKEQLARPSPQVVALKRELEQEQDTRRLDKNVSQEQRNRLQTDLTVALDRNKLLMSSLEQQTLLTEQLQSVIHSLREQLHASYLGKPNKAIPVRLPLEPVTPGTFFDTSLNPSNLPPELELQPEIDYISRNNFTTTPVVHDIEPRNRFLELEREAEVLDQRYWELHQRLLNRPYYVERYGFNAPVGHAEDTTPIRDYRRSTSTPSHFNFRRRVRTEAEAHGVRPSSVQLEEKMFSLSPEKAKRNYQIVSDANTFDWSFSYVPRGHGEGFSTGKGFNPREATLNAQPPAFHSTVLEESDSPPPLEAEEETIVFSPVNYLPELVQPVANLGRTDEKQIDIAPEQAKQNVETGESTLVKQVFSEANVEESKEIDTDDLPAASTSKVISQKVNLDSMWRKQKSIDTEMDDVDKNSVPKLSESAVEFKQSNQNLSNAVSVLPWSENRLGASELRTGVKVIEEGLTFKKSEADNNNKAISDAKDNLEIEVEFSAKDISAASENADNLEDW